MASKTKKSGKTPQGEKGRPPAEDELIEIPVWLARLKASGPHGGPPPSLHAVLRDLVQTYGPLVSLYFLSEVIKATEGVLPWSDDMRINETMRIRWNIIADLSRKLEGR